MENPGRTADVVVIGAGAIGLAVAWRCAGAGARVIVIDHPTAGAASPVAAGMLAPVTEVHHGETALLRLNLASAALFPGFVRELEEVTGLDVGYRRCGTLMVARDEDDSAFLDHLFAFQQSLGLDSERLRSRDCRTLEPGLSPGVRGGIKVDGDHQVDNRSLLRALRQACGAAGVCVRHDRAVGIATTGERVSGVRLASGAVIACGTAVMAAGAWSMSVLGLPAEEAPPVRPVKGQRLHLVGSPDRPVAQRIIRGVDAYIVPRADGQVVVGATVEEKGFDTAVTAGAVHSLLRAAYELLPELMELHLVETLVGLRPGTPDNAPLLGAGHLAGLVIASGHYRNGILLTAVTADAITELVMTGRTPPTIAAFSPRRFARVARAAV